MRGSKDNVNRSWIFFDNFWKGLDRIFDAFTRREEPKREQNRPPRRVELFLVEIRIHKRDVGNAMWNDGDLLSRHAVDIPQHGGSPLRHHHELARALDQLTKDLTLFGVWIRQNGMQGHHRGHFGPPQQR